MPSQLSELLGSFKCLYPHQKCGHSLAGRIGEAHDASTVSKSVLLEHDFFAFGIGVAMTHFDFAASALRAAGCESEGESNGEE